MRIIMKIQLHSNESDESDDSSSVGSAVSSEESSSTILANLEEELIAFEPMFDKIQEHLEAFEKRVKQPPINSFFPATESVLAWCNKKGLTSPFSLEEWFQAVLTDVVSTDLESRMLNFGYTDVPWAQREITVFDLLRGVPTYFRHLAPCT